VDEQLASFIHFGKILSAEQRRKLAQQLVAHLYDPLYDVQANWHKLKFTPKQKRWEELMQEVFAQNEVRQLTTHNEDLTLSVSQNLLTWLHKTARDLEIGHAHTDELLQFKSWRSQATQKRKQQWLDLLDELLERYSAQRQSWSFYKKKLPQELKATADSLASEQSLSVIQQNIFKDWESFLFRKKENFERNFLKESFNTYYEQLRQKVDQLNELGEILEPYYRHLGQLWNQSLTEWNRIPWDQIEAHVKTMRSDKSLKELADILGRWQMVELEVQEEKREKIIAKNSWKPNPYGKSEIIGIHYSDHISGTLPMEFAMLSHEDTEMIFSLRFAEKKLLSFQYRAMDMASEETAEEEPIKEPKIAEQGPIILVIDTSGSMFGKPEQIAKAISFVILSRALKHKRPCYVISFSDGFQTLELNEIGQEWDRMIEFLQLSFHGGTDIQPALQQALKMLKAEKFTKADVLVISDFMITRIEERVRDEVLHQRQQMGTQFHSLYITRSVDPGAVPLAIFDHHWIYDLDDPGVIRQTLEALDGWETEG